MADVIIIGGGPAGSMTGSYLSKAGVDNLIIEKAMHPRRHIGESMVPSTTRNFEDIGFLPVMERENFPKKYGAAWHPTSAKGEVSIVFAEFPQPGVDQDYTYHVDRGKLDHLLLQHAKSLGSNVIQGVAVKEVLFDDDNHACGVRVDIEGQTMDIPAKMVIDCSGRATVLGGQLGLRIKDPLFNQFAVSTWFENVHRGTIPPRPTTSTSTSCPSSGAGCGRSRSPTPSRRWASSPSARSSSSRRSARRSGSGRWWPRARTW